MVKKKAPPLQPTLCTSSRLRTLGFDPSLRHGVLVEAEWELGLESPELISYEVLVSWTTPRRKRGPLGAHSSIYQIHKFSQWFLDEVAHTEITGVPIGVDFHPMSVFWGNRKAGLVMTYMMGYVARGLQVMGLPVVYLNPNDVRQAFELPSRTAKEEVWKYVPFQLEGTSDERDALILSYIVAEAMHNGVRS